MIYVQHAVSYKTGKAVGIELAGLGPLDYSHLSL